MANNYKETRDAEAREDSRSTNSCANGNKSNTRRKRGRYNGKKTKNKETSQRKMDSKDVLHDYNDASWYARNKQLLTDAASLSFNNALGEQISWETAFGTQWSKIKTVNPLFTSIPGVMKINFVFGPGVSNDFNSPINIASYNIYSNIRKANSGAKNYDAPDLMLYLLALDSMYVYYNMGKRAYGVAMTYSQYNRYYPVAALQAMGFDAMDIINNMADFRFYLNSLAARLNSFAVPAVMSMMVRHSWMVSNIYADSSNRKAQTYIMTPNLFYQYDETGSRFGGQLKTLLWDSSAGLNPTDPNSLENYMKWGDQMFNALMASEDIGTMSGDIIKAYGEGKLFVLSPLSEEYKVVPVYNESVLNQIHNSNASNFSLAAGTINPGTLNDDLKYGAITQDPNTGTLLYQPTSLVTQFFSPLLINVPWDNPSPEDVIEATRLMSYVENTATGTYYKLAGTEIVSSYSVFTFAKYNASSAPVLTQHVCKSYLFGVTQGANTGTSILNSWTEAMLMSQFDWHPMQFMFARDKSEDTQFTLMGLSGDMANYTFIAPNVLMKMHLTAVLSELDVPAEFTV